MTPTNSVPFKRYSFRTNYPIPELDEMSDKTSKNNIKRFELKIQKYIAHHLKNLCDFEITTQEVLNAKYFIPNIINIVPIPEEGVDTKDFFRAVLLIISAIVKERLFKSCRCNLQNQSESLNNISSELLLMNGSRIKKYSCSTSDGDTININFDYSKKETRQKIYCTSKMMCHRLI